MTWSIGTGREEVDLLGKCLPGICNCLHMDFNTGEETRKERR